MLRVYAYPGPEWSFQRGGPLVQPVDREARTLGWVDALGTTLQMWVPWVRAEIPWVQSLPPAAMGRRATRPNGAAAGGAEAPEKRPQKA